MRRRRRIYLTLMGICALLYLISWTVVAPYSRVWAVALTGVASIIPLVAVIIANRDGST
ncbi:hypothetical protein GCM10023191_033880 [Actinoallomurus oryzae]|uniref:DUF3099 domain-containing protein n=1 Tax=Actinoallomurus oryzae TaxID=502180 RepID=A0ABP8PYT7_9ACTN